MFFCFGGLLEINLAGVLAVLFGCCLFFPFDVT